jgi:DNA-binding XRE family transcriptional regulator
MKNGSYRFWKLIASEDLMLYVAKIEHTVKKFGQLLRKLRESNNWTQEDLAGELGVDRAYISQLERGVKNPSLITMTKLANVLAVKVSFAGVDLA